MKKRISVALVVMLAILPQIGFGVGHEAAVGTARDILQLLGDISNQLESIAPMPLPTPGLGNRTPPAPAGHASVVLLGYVEAHNGRVWHGQFSVSFLDNHSVVFQSTWGPPIRIGYQVQRFGPQQTRIVLFFPAGAEHLDLQFFAPNGGRFSLVAPMAMARMDGQFVTQLHM